MRGGVRGGEHSPGVTGMSWPCPRSCGCWPGREKKGFPLVSLLEGDRGSGFSGSRGGGRGGGARECRPRLAVSLGSQGLWDCLAMSLPSWASRRHSWNLSLLVRLPGQRL